MVLPFPPMCPTHAADSGPLPDEGVTAPGTTAVSRIAALVLGRLDRARLSDAARGLGEVEFVERADELSRAALRGRQPVGVVVVEPIDLVRAATAPAVARIRKLRPDLVIIAYCTRGSAGEMLAMGRAGADDLVWRGEVDVTARLRDAITRAGAGAADARLTVLAALQYDEDPQAIALITYCLQYGTPQTTTADVARHLGVHRKTLVRLCRLWGLPSPSALLTWVQLMVAAAMLTKDHRHIEDVAEALGLTGPQLRNSFKRYTGRRATEIRDGGGLHAIIEAFRAPAAYGRGPGRKRQPP